MSKMPQQKPGQSRQDYGTPIALIRAIEGRWGKLTIDLAATAENAKCPKFITPEEDSLKADWDKKIGAKGRGWLNMEFGDIDPWVEKAGVCSRNLILITPASIGSEWYAEHIEGIPETGDWAGWKAKTVGLRPRICFEGVHTLRKPDAAGIRRPVCEGRVPECKGCATYPKDCCLLLFGHQFRFEPILQTWRWDANG